DFVLPATGDPTAMQNAPHLSPSGAAAPIYVVDRTDIVRVFVDITERDANYVRGSDLRLLSSVNDARDLPAAGRELVIVARVQNVLHFRIFDSDGKRVVNTDEKQLLDKAPQIAELKSRLSDLWNAPRISPIDKDRILSALTPIFGRAQVPI